MIGNKLARSHLAAGHWGSPWRRVQLEQAAEKVRVWLQDKLITRGRWVELYLPVQASTPGVVPCTCAKNTTDVADHACLSCFGTKNVPGMLKVLHDTLFWCSAEDTSFALTNCEISTTKKVNVIVLSEGQTSGTIETQDKVFENVSNGDWQLKFDAYRRANGSAVALEFSTDLGATWTPIALTAVATPGLGFVGTLSGLDAPGTGNIRFRVTMTRVSASDVTPAFEILRMRRVRTEDTNRQIARVRPDYVDGRVLILRPWVQEQDVLEPGRGRLTEHQGEKTWTAPLDFFDKSLTRDTPACRVEDTAGLHAFYILSSGVQGNTRYVITKVSYNEQLGLFTQQWFDDRRAQDRETYSLIW